MFNKFFYPIAVFICTLEMTACTLTNTREGTFIILTDDKITISDSHIQSCSLKVKIGDEISFVKDINVNQESSLTSILKTNEDLYNEIALLLAQNNGDVTMKLNIPELLDTTLTFHLNIKDTSFYTTIVETGKCAKLYGVYDPINMESEIIKWLYRKKYKNLGEETIKKMCLYLQELNRTDYYEYATKDSIPVLSSFHGIDYLVSSDLIADNYYLFACQSEKSLEEFVEEMVSIKFEGAVHSLNQPIQCFREVSSSGIICIFLVGIDNDWDYRIIPLGLVCIDNKKPSLSFLKTAGTNETETNLNSDIVLNKNKVKILMPKEVPPIMGYAILDTKNWGGNGISANVNFSVYFGGDIKCLSMERDGNLAEWIGKDTFVLDLQGKSSPYIFSYELHLEDGDNYVPVTITDLRDNKTEFKFNVACTMTRDNSPIRIDNNVDVNVW